MITRTASTSPHKRRRYSASRKASLLARFHACGLTQKEFCRLHDMGYHTLNRWLNQSARNQDGRPTLIPVSIRPEVAGITTFEVVLANGRSLRVPAQFDSPALKRLLAVLEGSQA